jgi:hypothetical protein
LLHAFQLHSAFEFKSPNHLQPLPVTFTFKLQLAFELTSTTHRSHQPPKSLPVLYSPITGSPHHQTYIHQFKLITSLSTIKPISATIKFLHFHSSTPRPLQQLTKLQIPTNHPSCCPKTNAQKSTAISHQFITSPLPHSMFTPKAAPSKSNHK